MVRLGLDEWHERREQHRSRATALLGDVVDRRRRGQRHPVEDFLFDYYTLRPGELLAWHPGLDAAGGPVELVDPDGEFAGRRFYRHGGGVSSVDVAGFAARRAGTITWTVKLLAATLGNTPQLGCFGMHEWAMVYHLQPGETRHAQLPLRFAPERVAEVVEQVGVRCSHFDAFRFFTEDARPLNALQPTRERQPELDQPACLHANMDLYKFAGKLLPATDSALLLDTFELARDIRELDMRASAYDLSAWGYPPVAVETPGGRAAYVRAQRGFAERAEVLRRRVLAVAEHLASRIPQAPAVSP